MTVESMRKFMDAVKAAGIMDWEVMTDTAPTHYYNNDVSFNVLDADNNMMYNFTQTITTVDPYGANQISVKGADLSDIHEVRFGASLEKVKAFIEAYGLSLTDDQLKILVKINGGNYNLKPATGDYLTFKELTEDQIAALSPEEQARYQEALDAFNKRKNIQMPVQVTV